MDDSLSYRLAMLFPGHEHILGLEAIEMTYEEWKKAKEPYLWAPIGEYEFGGHVRYTIYDRSRGNIVIFDKNGILGIQENFSYLQTIKMEKTQAKKKSERSI